MLSVNSWMPSPDKWFLDLAKLVEAVKWWFEVFATYKKKQLVILLNIFVFTFCGCELQDTSLCISESTWVKNSGIRIDIPYDEFVR